MTTPKFGQRELSPEQLATWRHYKRVFELLNNARDSLWRNDLRAEHALREALQIIETLKGESQ